MEQTHTVAQKRPSKKPILVTGSHRSGSTWVGKVLALAPHTGYIHEPFNIEGCRQGICRVEFPYWFFYVTPETGERYHAQLKDTLDWSYSLSAEVAEISSLKDAARLVKDYSYFKLNQVRQARPIIKDPIALFSAEWLAHAFDMDVVLIVRHPAAFVASLKVADWSFPFLDLQNQVQLLTNELSEFRAEIDELASRTTADIIDQGILLWRIFHHQILKLKQRNPGWIVVRHEDLSREPADQFRALYEDLSLNFSDIAMDKFNKLVNSSGSKKPSKISPNITQVYRDSKSNIYSWKQRLTTPEISRIQAAVGDIAPQFYSNAEW